jgi:hypothetical protein
MKISLNLEVKKVGSGNIYQESSGRMVYLEDGKPVVFTTEKGEEFCLFEQGYDQGEFIKILFQGEWRIFRKDTLKPVDFVSKNKEIFHTFGRSIGWNGQAEEILFEKEWNIFDKKTGRAFS